MIYWELFWTFFKIGAFSFGGGYGMIPLITEELVYQHNWITMDQLVDMIAISQMTPGPIAINIATFSGFQIAGFWGSLMATVGVVAPAAIIVILGVSYFLRNHQHPIVQSVLKGIRPVVIALIAYAGISLSAGIINGLWPLIVAIVAFIASYRYNLHPITALLSGGALGILVYFIF